MISVTGAHIAELAQSPENLALVRTADGALEIRTIAIGCQPGDEVGCTRTGLAILAVDEYLADAVGEDQPIADGLVELAETDTSCRTLDEDLAVIAEAVLAKLATDADLCCMLAETIDELIRPIMVIDLAR